MQVDRVRRTFREERFAAEVIEHQRHFRRRVARGLGGHGGVQLGQAVEIIGEFVVMGFHVDLRELEN